MLRAATPEGILDIVGWLLLSLLIGVLAGKTAKYFGAPMEIRLLAFVSLTGIAMAIWHVGGKSEARADERTR
jgi:site-specific recombinase